MALEIGLWVGQSGTPNKLGHKGDNDDNSARSRVLAWSGGDNKPIQLITALGAARSWAKLP